MDWLEARSLRKSEFNFIKTNNNNDTRGKFGGKSIFIPIYSNRYIIQF